MRLITFSNNGLPALAARIDDEIVNLTEQGLPTSLEEFLRAGSPAKERAEKVLRSGVKRQSIKDLSYLPPLRGLGKAIAVGLNYRDHASESKLEAPAYPVLFHRYPSSWVAHRAFLVRPAVSNQFDYEGELVVVIGRGGRHIQTRRALEHVAGYSIFNDGSVRDYQFKSAQWMVGKNFDQSGAFGPEFVTSDELPAGARGLRLQTRVNAVVLQDANTRDMIFDVATLIATCSEVMALETGDMIITGTPAGVGVARKPPLFLTAGDVCEVDIEGIGVLSNPVMDEPIAQLT